MEEHRIELRLSIDGGAGVDEEEMAELFDGLQHELLELDVEGVNFEQGKELPPGAKAAGVFDWGALIVTLATAGGVLTSLITLLQSWLTRNNLRSLKLEIGGDTLEVVGISSEEQQRLVDAWLSRHSVQR